MINLSIAAQQGLKGGWALEQSLFNHFYFDQNIPFEPKVPRAGINTHCSACKGYRAPYYICLCA